MKGGFKYLAISLTLFALLVPVLVFDGCQLWEKNREQILDKTEAKAKDTKNKLKQKPDAALSERVTVLEKQLEELRLKLIQVAGRVKRIEETPSETIERELGGGGGE